MSGGVSPRTMRHLAEHLRANGVQPAAMRADDFIIQPCGDVICPSCDAVVHSVRESTTLGSVVADADRHLCPPRCVAEYHDPYQGAWSCWLRPGHRGEHEDNDGHWWPTDDQLRTW